MKKATSSSSKQARNPRIWVKYLVRDLDLNKYHFDLRFRTVDHGIGVLQVPRASINAPGQLAKELLDAGALLPPDPKAAAELVKESLLRLNTAPHRERDKQAFQGGDS